MTIRENPRQAMKAKVAVVPTSLETERDKDKPDNDFEARLDEWLTSSCSATPLQAAMRYAALAPGKRTRPKLVIEIAGHNETAVDIACAVEMIHAASLILDDLPCMDDAQLRRGRATTHLVFGQSVAILAAVSLISLAFEVLARLPVPSAQSSVLIQELSSAIGADGMAAGQVLDLDHSATSLVSAEVVNALKTGALFVAAVNMSAEVADLGRRERECLADFAVHLGLAFQIYDDIKDATSTESETGKTVGADKDKSNVVNRVGVRRSWTHLMNRLARAEKCFASAGFDASKLRSIFSPVYDAA